MGEDNYCEFSPHILRLYKIFYVNGKYGIQVRVSYFPDFDNASPCPIFVVV